MLWPLAAWVCIFGVSGSPWAAFWTVLGTSWATFCQLWGSLWLHFGKPGSSFGAPWTAWQCLSAPLGAQEQIFPLFSASFWMHFGWFLDLKIDAKKRLKNKCKFDVIFGGDLGWFLEHFGMDFEEMFGCARDAPTLRKYRPRQQIEGSGPQLGDQFVNKNPSTKSIGGFYFVMV